GGSPDGEAIAKPRVEDVAAQYEHCAVDRDVVASMNLADNAQVVGELCVGRKCIEIAKLGIDVEIQQERHPGILASLPDDYSISITFAVVRCCGNRCRLERR